MNTYSEGDDAFSSVAGSSTSDDDARLRNMIDNRVKEFDKKDSDGRSKLQAATSHLQLIAARRWAQAPMDLFTEKLC